MGQDYQQLSHPFAALYTPEAEVLILGTFPSPKARERGLPYGHPQNRFWPVMAAILKEDLPDDAEGRRQMLLRHHVALWDVLESCDIQGASDASIKNPVVNDFSQILNDTQIKAIFCTGAKAAQLYRKYAEPNTQMPCVQLPSTSPANASLRLNDLIDRYQVIADHLSDQAKVGTEISAPESDWIAVSSE